MPPATPPAPPPDYDRNALFALDGPIDPDFISEAVRTLLRALPLDTGEPESWITRRMRGALTALAALHPRDEIEVMLGVQTVAAYHAASAGWYLAMNRQQPRGDSTRHLNGAASAARTFDTLLKALERRQARPLTPPSGRPPGQPWPPSDPAAETAAWQHRVGGDAAQDDPDNPGPVWTPATEHRVAAMRTAEQAAEDYAGLDLANTPGIRPDGGIVVPEDPTEAQRAYMARRYGLNLREQHQANLAAGHDELPKIRPLRPGDLIP